MRAKNHHNALCEQQLALRLDLLRDFIFLNFPTCSLPEIIVMPFRVVLSQNMVMDVPFATRKIHFGLRYTKYFYIMLALCALNQHVTQLGYYIKSHK